MASFIKKLAEAGRRFTAYDFAVFKLTLLSVGILLGAYFSRFFLDHITVVWVVAALCWILMLLQTLRHYRR